MFAAIPKGFFPTEDIGQLSVSTEARQDISFPPMVEPAARGRGRSSQRSPHVAHVVSRVGSTGFSGTMNAGSFFVELKPKDERRELAEGARRPAARAFAWCPASRPSYAGAEPAPRRPRLEEPVPVRRAGPEQDRARPLGGAARRRHGPRPATFTGVTTDLQNTALQATREDRPRQGRGRSASRPTSCARRSTPASARGRSRPSTRPATATRSSPSSIRASNWTAGPARPRAYRAPATASSSRSSAFAPVERTAGPLSINQLGQLPAVTISFDTPAGVSLGDAVSGSTPSRRELGVPTTISTTFAGTAQVFQDALANQGAAHRRGHHHDLHRARHPLRELRPPADHPDRPAGGGGRRARRAASCSGSTSRSSRSSAS